MILLIWFSFFVQFGFAQKSPSVLHCQNQSPTSEVQTINIYPHEKDFETVVDYYTYEQLKIITNIKELELYEINLPTPYGDNVGFFQIKKIVDDWFILEHTPDGQTRFLSITCEERNGYPLPSL